MDRREALRHAKCSKVAYNTAAVIDRGVGLVGRARHEPIRVADLPLTVVGIDRGDMADR